MQKIFVISILGLFLTITTTPLHAQTNTPTPELTENTDETLEATASDELQIATESASIASPSAEEVAELEQIRREDITQPEPIEEKDEVLGLFQLRPATKLTGWNFMAYAIQSAVTSGVPANTVILILLLPFLASMIAFSRHIIGLPTMGIIVPAALSITLLATGIPAGILLLTTIILGTSIARIVLKKIRIMFMPKMALSLFLQAIFVFIALFIGVNNGLITVKQLSIFPVLLLILLSERILALQLNRTLWHTTIITSINLFLGVVGFLFLSSDTVQTTILLYPELILFLVPINIAIGRYFGIRLSEYFRFRQLILHGRK